MARGTAFLALASGLMLERFDYFRFITPTAVVSRLRSRRRPVYFVVACSGCV
ncbi:unnamed protein product [Ectocarpus sp. CCAP 1310/34]|nr:unnamed protein product [Ectocarpus sp. CCAP 1310/34]